MNAPEESAPAPLSFCAGRLIRQPVVTNIRLYNGEPGHLLHGHAWLLDGEHVAADTALAFQRGWTAQNNGEASSEVTGTASSGETNSSKAPAGA